MYQEDIAKITADHLRAHVANYLAIIAARYDDPVPLVNPTEIIVASAVGGLIQEFDAILPKYAVDIFGKHYAETADDLNVWEYAGQISGLISANSQDSADKLVKRHAAGVELFISEHILLHQTAQSVWNDKFLIVSFTFSGSDYSGGEFAGTFNERDYWVAGFSYDCIWLAAEDDVSQHA